jgi:capsular polysaccharide biosynthesis protein
MTTENMLKLAKNHLKTAVLCGLLLGAISFLGLVMTQKNFRSNTDILMSQSQLGAMDYYALSQSANYLTNILSQSIYSEKFIEEVAATGKVSNNFLTGDSAQRLKQWQRIVHVKNNSSVGIMSIQVFGDTQSQTDNLAAAVLDVMVNHNSFFLGQDQNVNVRVLSGPIVEKNPSFAQIVMSSIGGFVVGVLFFLLFVIYREEFMKKEEAGEEMSEIKFTTKNNAIEDKIMSIENLPQEDSAEKLSISDEDYLAANSDYWKKKLENVRS